MSDAECHAIKTNFYRQKSGSKDIKVTEIPDSHMCAINRRTLGDACSGDSGGPIMHMGSNHLYHLMGIVSGSWTECGETTETAGLYTRVLYYRDIIKSIAPKSCWKNL